ncbi:MAG: Uncharacterized protein G01um101417_255 [Parcubacteria group bacterium Gr01-1014_17]|nr:MAG: Uncharacterized protein G01um101417_255 [Parcubacteria group bacterium Gr01-1014_17]
MTPEEKALIVKTAELVKENNIILRKMRRASRIGTVLHIFYWLIVIGLSFGAYYFIEPYIGQLQGIYQKIQGDVDNVRGAADTIGDFGKLLQ